MQKSLNRRKFIKSTVLGVAAVAIPYQILGSDKLFEIEVESSNMPDYKKTGTIRELRNHFRKEIRPVMADKLKELYDGTAMFALDLSDDPELLSGIFEKIKKGNFENVIKDRDYKEGQEDITFFNTIWRDYSLKGNFNNLEIRLDFDIDPEFTKITVVDFFYINNLNLDENGKNHPNRVYIADSRGDLFKEYGFQGKYLRIFTHLEGNKVDVGGLRTLLTRVLNKQKLIKKDLGLIRQRIGKYLVPQKILKGKVRCRKCARSAFRPLKKK